MDDKTTSKQDIDEALRVLYSSKDDWASLEVDERIGIMEDILRDMGAIGDRWVGACARAKGFRPGSRGEGEEWLFLAILFRRLRLIRQSLAEIKVHGRPRIPGPLTRRPGGQVVAKVYPETWLHGLLLRGVTGEVWLEPGVSPEEVLAGQARPYRQAPGEGKIALVLGAGNVSAVPPIDVMHKLFVEKRVVILKASPVNAYLVPLLEQGFRSLISRGFLRIIQGGAGEGSYLCQHPLVDEIHLTGSIQTFEEIVFGPGEAGARRKAERNPVCTKRITAELGNISPWIVVPGNWSQAEIKEQAAKFVFWFVNNTAFDCVTPRLIVQHRDWKHRHAFIEAMGAALAEVETRKAYYPGARARHADFLAAHPGARQFGNGGEKEDHLPWTFVTGVDPGKPDDICFKRESFCPLFAETALEASGVPEFIDRAVAFANETLLGNLAATIVASPRSLKDPPVAAAVQRAVAELRYGTVLLNAPGGYGYYMGTTIWGGFPGHDIYNVQSGIGWGGNVLMFDRPQKAVISAPFRTWPDPLRLASRRLAEFGRRMADFELSPSTAKLPGLIWTALRS